MPPIKRRLFLQGAGSAIASLSLNSCNLKPRLDTLRGVQTSARKLALLVGINDYPETSQLSSLNGCINDVELQRHLLIYRFGFNPQDILTLTNQKATRQGILDAFEIHLINQAKPGDIVVFHYSGHGSQVADPDNDYPDGLNSTLVPFDSQRPANPSMGSIVQDITGHTLFLLMTALKTENVTVVLDCCHSGGAKRGNLQIRAV
ncbi:MAG: caspase family protein, partial [Tolypothrix sp. T3-bin4]|nr:caspase family protein [Tolypothrix sp. T3-bin4]